MRIFNKIKQKKISKNSIDFVDKIFILYMNIKIKINIMDIVSLIIKGYSQIMILLYFKCISFKI